MTYEMNVAIATTDEMYKLNHCYRLRL